MNFEVEWEMRGERRVMVFIIDGERYTSSNLQRASGIARNTLCARALKTNSLAILFGTSQGAGKPVLPSITWWSVVTRLRAMRRPERCERSPALVVGWGFCEQPLPPAWDIWERTPGSSLRSMDERGFT